MNSSEANELPSSGLKNHQSTLIQPRLFSELQGARSTASHLAAYGPLWEPPAIAYLVYNTLIRVWEAKSEPIEILPLFRKRMQTAEAALLYGPAMQLLSDSGWYKSKWNLREGRENDRWGGWYDHLKLELEGLKQTQLSDEQVNDYLPVGVKFPTATMKTTSQESSRYIPNNLINRWAMELNQGSLSFYAGPLRVEKSENEDIIKQEKVTFQRFASCQLKSLIPDKAGFMFNAGAPVWSMDFLPASNLTKHSSCLDHNGHVLAYDFLALSTISKDPGLLPPIEISKRLEDNVKSLVQIWCIPHQEPYNFSDPPVKSPSDQMGRALCTHDHDEINLKHENQSPQLSMLLAFPNQATCLRWCPRGGSKFMVDPTASTQHVDSLGLLAIAFFDGVVGLYNVPHPFHVRQLSKSNPVPSIHFDNSNQVISLNLVPVARLMLPGTSCLTLEWANHDILAGGCMNGHIVIWHIETLLQLLQPVSQEPLLIRPTHFKPMHAAPIKSISWIRTPPINQFGIPDVEGDPCFLSSTGIDGSVKMLDTLDLTASNSFLHERGETTSVSFSSVMGCLMMADSDYSIKAICLKPRDLGVSKKLLAQLGLVWQISTSDYHSFVAYAAADGVCGLASSIRPQKYRSRATMWVPKVYQMDFNRQTSELRMLDNLMPQSRSQDGTTVTESKSKPTVSQKKSNSSTQQPEKKSQHPFQFVSPIGVHPSVVGVNCVCWNKILTKGCVLASGMGCGLVRIDYVEAGFNNANNTNKDDLSYHDLVLELINSGNPAVNLEEEGED